MFSKISSNMVRHEGRIFDIDPKIEFLLRLTMPCSHGISSIEACEQAILRFRGAPCFSYTCAFSTSLLARATKVRHEGRISDMDLNLSEIILFHEMSLSDVPRCNYAKPWPRSNFFYILWIELRSCKRKVISSVASGKIFQTKNIK